MEMGFKIMLEQFQSTCLREARLKVIYTVTASFEFQSTCLREARPTPRPTKSSGSISIHVPTRGTTGIALKIVTHDAISIHVPTRGTTPLSLPTAGAGTFQSTCLREARQSLSSPRRHQEHFNPRAYARHDPFRQAITDLYEQFQSTCLREARRLTTCDSSPTYRFQSTCLREARRACKHMSTVGSNFNPRAYARHDGGGRRATTSLPYFNPRAYARHDTGVGGLSSISEFQSTCLREARPGATGSLASGTYFNPRAYARHDLIVLDVDVPFLISIHVPTRGTTSSLRAARVATGFQSTCLREARHQVNALIKA